MGLGSRSPEDVETSGARPVGSPFLREGPGSSWASWLLRMDGWIWPEGARLLGGKVTAASTRRFTACSASGLLAVIRAAIVKASASTRSDATTRLIKPRATARWASIGSPVRRNSRAAASGIRVARWQPPLPGINPRGLLAIQIWHDLRRRRCRRLGAARNRHRPQCHWLRR